MNIPNGIDEELKELWLLLIRLHNFCRSYTKSEYNRINPFIEDLFDWNDRGVFWMQEDKGITIYNSTTVVGDVRIGNNTWIGPYCSLDGTGGLEIGKFCSISLGCQLLSHDTVKWALSGGRMSYEYANTKIGDCCFLGSYAVISKGVTIGNHCLIAAGAVVTKDVGDFIIAGGVPARPIGRVHLDSQGKVHLVYNKL